MVWCGVVWCGVVWCVMVLRGMVWCGVVRCGVVFRGVVSRPLHARQHETDERTSSAIPAIRATFIPKLWEQTPSSKLHVSAESRSLIAGQSQPVGATRKASQKRESRAAPVEEGDVTAIRGDAIGHALAAHARMVGILARQAVVVRRKQRAAAHLGVTGYPHAKAPW